MKNKVSTSRLVRLASTLHLLNELKRRGVDLTQIYHSFESNGADLLNSAFFVPADKMYSLMKTFAEGARDPAFGVVIGQKTNVNHWPSYTEATMTADSLPDFPVNPFHISNAHGASVDYTPGVQVELNRAGSQLIIGRKL